VALVGALVGVVVWAQDSAYLVALLSATWLLTTNRSEGQALRSLLIDGTLIGIAIVAIGLPAWAAVLPLLYVTMTALLVLPFPTALLAGLWAASWGALAVAAVAIYEQPTVGQGSLVAGVVFSGLFAAPLSIVFVQARIGLRTLSATSIDRARLQTAIADASQILLKGEDDGELLNALEILMSGTGCAAVFVRRELDTPTPESTSALVATATRHGLRASPSLRTDPLPWDTMSAARLELHRGEPVILLTANLAGERRRGYEEAGIVSELYLPIAAGSQSEGLIGFSDISARRWSDEDLRLLQTTAEVISVCWERQRTSTSQDRLVTALGERLRYEKALSECSQALLVDDDEALHKALQALLEATTADYAYIDKNYTDPELGLCARITHDAWCPETDGPQQGARGRGRPYSEFPSVLTELDRGRPMHITVRSLTGRERSIYERNGRKSELKLPIKVRDRWQGSIGFADYKNEHSWSHNEVSALQTAAEMVGVHWERGQARQELEELVKSKDEFVASVSHELRTPLSAVVALSHELADPDITQDDEEATAFVSMIAEQSSEVANLVEDLLVAARADHDLLVVHRQPVELRPEVESVLQSFTPSRLEDRQITVSGPLVSVWGDPVRIRQILRNLIGNALLYGGPAITITITPGASATEIAVTDDGDGIPEAEADRIFEAYERLRAERTRTGSVGLGLTVSRTLARLMAGDLQYRQEEDRSSFVLSLPSA
jgi:signal transduction histidine kinase